MLDMDSKSTDVNIIHYRDSKVNSNDHQSSLLENPNELVKRSRTD
jgi:hypothetical protein